MKDVAWVQVETYDKRVNYKLLYLLCYIAREMRKAMSIVFWKGDQSPNDTVAQHGLIYHNMAYHQPTAVKYTTNKSRDMISYTQIHDQQ